MNEADSNTKSNLAFFESAILAPAETAFDLSEVFREEDSLDGYFGIIEAALWARLGILIGYLDVKDVQGFLSTARASRAWSVLSTQAVGSLEHEWANVIVFKSDETGIAVLDTSLFSEQVGAETRDYLRRSFQTLLLLAAENILDHSSHEFLDGIGWSTTSGWMARKRGGPQYRYYAQDLGAGFANVLNYWGEVDSVFESLEAHNDVFPTALVPGFEKMGIVAPGSEVQNFIEEVLKIVTPRFNLGQPEVVERYFVLAGEFVNRARDDSPEWLDARVNVFRRLASQIRRFGGESSYQQLAGRLFNLFSNGNSDKETDPSQIRNREPEQGFF